ncbi:phage tail domain-containing protein [Actinokineospora cianjurensis]|uniref:Tail protein n=1 Tax=Actinokineospora cianjurensis TaxID=585224 RepID=A0A421AYG1_9PSEU|nr:phage tail domain-containing protein [Actinokineospora cianjurensis]RLK54819.1 tail protein [Actinokineospora cianjurensis]
MPPSGLPLRVRWTVDGREFNGPPDQLGRDWVIDKVTGWSSSPGVRDSQAAPRTGAHGSWPGTVYREARTIRLDGWVYAPTWEARRDAEHRLAALCSDPEGHYELRCTEETGDLVAGVVQDDATLVTVRPGGLWLDFSLQLVAADPRKYAATEQTTTTRLPISSTTGLDFVTGGGLTFTGGLDFGPQAFTGRANATNTGTADTAPVFALAGPLTPPITITRRGGSTLTYLDPVTAEQRLVIDTRERLVLLDNVPARTRAVVTDWDALTIPPAATGLYVLSHADNPNPTATLTITWRSAWW